MESKNHAKTIYDSPQIPPSKHTLKHSNTYTPHDQYSSNLHTDSKEYQYSMIEHKTPIKQYAQQLQEVTILICIYIQYYIYNCIFVFYNSNQIIFI
jgi:hypothetical protein